MPSDPVEQFANNWAYLKTELNWLDRVLMLAVTRQRKESKDIDRIAQSRADRVTSHWWKGIISVESEGYDEYRQPVAGGAIAKPGYQQQLETRIHNSRVKGVVLGLPLLCDRLGLTLFEKHLILMSLAPEVNRRYARLYRYLQGEDPVRTDLPTIDLVLRLLCRNDQEWRTARTRLTLTSPLIQHDLLRLLPSAADTLLNRYAKLDDRLLDYLLAEQPTVQGLERLLTAPQPQFSALLSSRQIAIDWATLILPSRLLGSLQRLVNRIQVQTQAENLPFGQVGVVVLLVGTAGTGKTLAAAAIAHALKTPLFSIDLALVHPETYPQVMQEILIQAPKVLLLESAQLWFGRSVTLAPSAIAHFLDQRRQMAGMTLIEARTDRPLRPYWLQQFDQILTFERPQRRDRLRLWRQAFLAEAALTDLDWDDLAQFPLTGGEIGAIALETAVELKISGDANLTLRHLKQALAQQGKSRKS
jgi:hypothetical protein